MPHLELLKLSNINSRKLWDDNLPGHSSIQNLMSLTIDKCGSIAYAFSSSVAIELVNLHYLGISNCAMMEEIFVSDRKLGSLPSQKPLSDDEVSSISNSITINYCLISFSVQQLVQLTIDDLSILLIVGYISKLGDIGNLPHGTLEDSLAQSTSSKFLLQTEAVEN
jgi:hypothetical protein